MDTILHLTGDNDLHLTGDTTIICCEKGESGPGTQRQGHDPSIRGIVPKEPGTLQCHQLSLRHGLDRHGKLEGSTSMPS